MIRFRSQDAGRGHLTLRPIRHSLIAAMALAPVALANGAVGQVARLLAVFFGCHFLLLLAVSLFTNLRWQLTPPPACR
jgi:hypothetical protein